ncbi:MAG TPA: hypothetical protein P5048_04980 [Chlamydiales bacterium]|nr:hypothetical protein [Chlamydiales bacterium]
MLFGVRRKETFLTDRSIQYREAAGKLTQSVGREASNRGLHSISSDGCSSFGRGRVTEKAVRLRRLRRQIFATKNHQKDKLAAKINRLLVENFELMNGFKRAVSDLGMINRSFTMTVPSFEQLIEGRDVDMRSYGRVDPEEVCGIYQDVLTRLLSFAINQYKNASGRMDHVFDLELTRVQDLTAPILVTVRKR